MASIVPCTVAFLQEKNALRNISGDILLLELELTAVKATPSISHNLATAFAQKAAHPITPMLMAI